MDQVLVLNRNYQPVQIISPRRAIVLMYIGSAQALSEDFSLFSFEKWLTLSPCEGDSFIQGVRQSFIIPKTIILSNYDRLPKLELRLSRENIYARDSYRCQYCGSEKERSQLNLDHVIPRSRGGGSSWENIVCCCISCNLKKGNKTPKEARMKLIATPKKPAFHPYFNKKSIVPHVWRCFLETITSL